MAITIAIDGTAASGKGSAARKLAKRLDFYHLDTGAIYRSIAFYMTMRQINIEDEKEVNKWLKELEVEVVLKKDSNGERSQKNIIFDLDLGDKIRTEKVTYVASIISQYEQVRKFACAIQHKLAKKNNIVVEGRDIGTVVFPKATKKFYITAKPEVRAQRRLSQLKLPQSDFSRILEEINARDNRDKTRKICPLKLADDAIYIDNSTMNVDETVDLMLTYINK